VVFHTFKSEGDNRSGGVGLPSIEGLGSNEELFRALSTHTPVGLFVSNANGGCVYVNGRWCELAGLTAAEAMGDGWSVALHPDDSARVGNEWAEASADGRDSIVEYRFRRPGGGVSWIQGFASALRDRRGQVVGWVGTCLDLTDRRQVEAALAEEGERFRAAFEDAPIGMALVAPEGLFLRVNRTLCELTGYSESELLERSFQDITHPDDLDADLDQVQRVLAGEIRSYQLAKRYRHRDGRLVWVMLSVSLVRDRDHRPVYFVSQIEDITARKQAECKLQHLADHDPLTGLLNRRRFNEELEREVARTKRHGGRAVLLVIDVDRFKLVNDSLGHPAGDDVLRAVARTLEGRLRSTDVISRIGGDEFAVIAVVSERDAQGRQLADEVATAIRRQTIVASGSAVKVTSSIGVAPIASDTGLSADELFITADDAMYRAKRSGRDQIAQAA
jgi:diguanylate cyclase (GGDEF)-like protein/PAS domain S-box-containing protein